MEFLRPKIIVKKDEEGNYILKKKANITSDFIFSYFQRFEKNGKNGIFI